MQISKTNLIRPDGLGGTDIAAACGLSKFKNIVELWCEKKAGLPQKKPKSSTNIDLGVMSEDIILEVYSEKFLENKEEIFRPSKVYHHKHKFLYSHIDAKTENSIIEIKFCGAKEWEKIPVEYVCQMVHYLNIYPTIPSAYLAVWFSNTKASDKKKLNLFIKLGAVYNETEGHEEIKRDIKESIDNEIVVYQYNRDDDLQKLLEDKACEFWWFVKHGQIPISKKYSPLSADEFDKKIVELIDKKKIFKL